MCTTTESIRLLAGCFIIVLHRVAFIFQFRQRLPLGQQCSAGQQRPTTSRERHISPFNGCRCSISQAAMLDHTIQYFISSQKYRLNRRGLATGSSAVAKATVPGSMGMVDEEVIAAAVYLCWCDLGSIRWRRSQKPINRALVPLGCPQATHLHHTKPLSACESTN